LAKRNILIAMIQYHWAKHNILIAKTQYHLAKQNLIQTSLLAVQLNDNNMHQRASINRFSPSRKKQKLSQSQLLQKSF